MTSKDNLLLQPYTISRATYKCGAVERKLLFFGALQIQKSKTAKNPNITEYSAEFSMAELLSSLGMSKNNGNKELIKKAVATIADNKIILYEDQTNIDVINWIQRGIVKDNTVTLIFSNPVGELFFNCKDRFSAINPLVIGSLKSYYSMRYYELALSYRGYAGKNGNKINQWYFSYSLDDLRTIFKCDAYQYDNGTRDFIKKVVKNPIDELNANNDEFSIMIDTIKDPNDARRTTGIKFLCTRTTAPKRAKKQRIDCQAEAEAGANEYSAYLAQGGNLMQSITRGGKQ